MREILFRGYSTVHRKWFYGDLLHCSDGLRISNEESFVGVSKKTIGQFTGLTDKNGKKIFEGDVFDYADCSRYTVVWSDDKVGFYADGITISDFDFLGNFYEEEIEIIGNIHDNPELLGG